MKRWVIFIAALALIGGTGWVLSGLQRHQRLGLPGVKTSPLSGSRNLVVDLPEQVLDCKSERLETDDIVLGTLPKDTSFGQRRYLAPDGFETMVNVVLMGTDRTSLHMCH